MTKFSTKQTDVIFRALMMLIYGIMVGSLVAFIVVMVQMPREFRSGIMPDIDKEFTSIRQDQSEWEQSIDDKMSETQSGLKYLARKDAMTTCRQNEASKGY